MKHSNDERGILEGLAVIGFGIIYGIIIILIVVLMKQCIF